MAATSRDDWVDYLRDGALKRSLVAGALSITRSTMYTNSAIKYLVDNLEVNLRGCDSWGAIRGCARQ